LWLGALEGQHELGAEVEGPRPLVHAIAALGVGLGVGVGAGLG